jgi:RHS repeat-associated protein
VLFILMTCLHNRSESSDASSCRIVRLSSAIRPHAVDSIPGIGSFSYDDNGNLLSGAGRSLTWTSFDMPATAAKAATVSTPAASASFVYGPEHQRTRQIRSDGSSVVYAGPQEVETKAGLTTVKTYWPYGVGVEIDRGTAATELNWTHVDRLGSPVAMSTSTGTLREKLAYDAWGKRRTLDGAPLNGTPTPDTIDGLTDNRGFTGHEMLDQLDLVHMNGRIYDPLTARFMSADPILQDPMNGQSYNRYSYVMNNPTNFTDPTGFCANSTESRFCAGMFEKAEKWVQDVSTKIAGLGESAQASVMAAASKVMNAVGMAELGQAVSQKNEAATSTTTVNGGEKTDAKKPSSGAAQVAGKLASATKNMVDGGYGDKAVAAKREGNYIEAAGNVALGTVHSTLFVLTLGVGAEAAASLTIGKSVAAEAIPAVEALAAKSAGQLGREGEALASQITGVGKNTQSFVVNGRSRIPDQVISQDMMTRNPLHIVESKNVQYQALTRQLRDNVDLVGPGGRVDVMLPTGAKVTGPLQRAFDNPLNPLNRVDLK